MLLSDKTTAAFIKSNFVSTWKEVRAVPKVTIDFGNGKTMRRTIAGNTVMYLSLPDGTVVDAFPGVYTPKDFIPLLKSALVATTKAMSLSGSGRLSYLRNWHSENLQRSLEAELARTTASKTFVESPLLEATRMVGAAATPNRSGATESPLLAKSDPFVSAPTTASKAMVQSTLLRGAGVSSGAPRNPSRSKFEVYCERIEDTSKKPATTDQLLTRFRLPRDTDPKKVAQMILNIDSETNAEKVHPAIDMLLSERSAKSPDELCDTIYKQLLHIALDDPYLGLRGIEMPGTPDH